MHRRRRAQAEIHSLRIEPNLILELHQHKLLFYSKLDENRVCDRCHNLYSDEGWKCEQEECKREVEVGGRLGTECPFFCNPCYSDCARLQMDCLTTVVSEKAREETMRKSRTPNLRTNWKDESMQLGICHQDLLVFDSLVQAVVHGNLERVKEIVDHSEFSRHIQIEDTLPSGPHYGKTPLLLAAEGGHRSIVTLLLERGANREVADVKTGMTPLMIASYCGHSSVVDELVHVGVTVDRLSGAGYTAAHYAAVSGHAPVLRRLIKFGADVLIRTPQGRTPLIIASCNGHPEAVQELAGMMPRDAILLPDREGYTALEVAAARSSTTTRNSFVETSSGKTTSVTAMVTTTSTSKPLHVYNKIILFLKSFY